MGVCEKIVIIFIVANLLQIDSSPFKSKNINFHHLSHGYSVKPLSHSKISKLNEQILSNNRNAKSVLSNDEPGYKTNFHETEFPFVSNLKRNANYDTKTPRCEAYSSTKNKPDTSTLRNIKMQAKINRKLNACKNLANTEVKRSEFQTSNQPCIFGSMGFPEVEYPLNIQDTWRSNYYWDKFSENQIEVPNICCKKSKTTTLTPSVTSLKTNDRETENGELTKFNSNTSLTTCFQIGNNKNHTDTQSPISFNSELNRVISNISTDLSKTNDTFESSLPNILVTDTINDNYTILRLNNYTSTENDTKQHNLENTQDPVELLNNLPELVKNILEDLISKNVSLSKNSSYFDEIGTEFADQNNKPVFDTSIKLYKINSEDLPLLIDELIYASGEDEKVLSIFSEESFDRGSIPQRERIAKINEDINNVALVNKQSVSDAPIVVSSNNIQETYFQNTVFDEPINSITPISSVLDFPVDDIKLNTTPIPFHATNTLISDNESIKSTQSSDPSHASLFDDEECITALPRTEFDDVEFVSLA